MENSVESVEIHPKKRRQRWTGNTSLYPGGASWVEAGNSLEEKTAILWQRKSAYVILQDESISDSVTKTGNFQMQEASFHRN